MTRKYEIVKWGHEVAHLKKPEGTDTLCGISVPNEYDEDFTGDVTVCQSCQLARASASYDDLETKG